MIQRWKEREGRDGGMVKNESRKCDEYNGIIGYVKLINNNNEKNRKPNQFNYNNINTINSRLFKNNALSNPSNAIFNTKHFQFLATRRACK